MFSKKMVNYLPKLTLPINYKEATWMERKRAREQYTELQNGKCWYCHENLLADPSMAVQLRGINTKLFPKGMFDHPIHLHHCHKTQMTIGSVHAKCNAILWQYHGE